ncbi:head GIN domain-containing protein [Labilibaculum sp. K2S]|uniref:head GIN domain-containing protein n=1 Tax=Labilibaculum sp. K2S TaxID=3056386 RepID=UPI0025A3A5E6|nr:head GIN domain-containing protein [Labilibaculum sp. K2S]MDM8160474.1 head GIN domain-containing protein [Labilibaculum sp. K2S]
MTRLIQKTSLLIVLLSFLLSSNVNARFWSKKGNGNIQKENREIASFSVISASMGINVYIVQGDKESLIVETDENLLDNITTRVKGNELIIKIDGHFRRATKLNVYVTLVDVYEINILSGAKVETRGALTTTNLDINISSGGFAKMEINANDITCNTSSGANALLTGKANYFSGEASSGSHLEAKELIAKVGQAKASGVAGVSLYASEAIDARASSFGYINYYGHPEEVNTSDSNGGDVNRR